MNVHPAGYQLRVKDSLGRWLIENMPRGVDLEVPDRRSARDVPFSGGDDE